MLIIAAPGRRRRKVRNQPYSNACGLLSESDQEQFMTTVLLLWMLESQNDIDSFARIISVVI